jgi:hypothetical protein
LGWYYARIQHPVLPMGVLTAWATNHPLWVGKNELHCLLEGEDGDHLLVVQEVHCVVYTCALKGWLVGWGQERKRMREQFQS